MNTPRSLVLALAALVLQACATPYTPNPNRPFEPIPEFTSSQTVELVNAQTSTEEHDIGASILANYHAWTDVAIEIARRELETRGASFAPDAPRRLELSIIDVDYEVGWIKIRTTIRMEARTGDGYVGTYTGVNSSAMAAIPKRQIDGAMMRVVVELLKDPAIVAYLR